MESFILTPQFIVSAFVAGMFMFIAPCTLPLVPAFLGVLGGVSLADAGGEITRRDRVRIVRNTVFYILGFSLVFILLGLGASAAASFLRSYQEILLRIAGVLLILFGFSLLGFLKIPFVGSEKKFPILSYIKKPGAGGSFLIGVAFATGWSPCAGPITGAILTVAATSGRAIEGAVLLSIFSLGLAIPFLLSAFFFGEALRLIKHAGSFLSKLYTFSGVLLIALGVLLITDNFILLIVWGYKLSSFFGYEEFLFRFL